MNRNLSELEQRLVTILKEDSRKSISDISLELDVSRTTARKAMDSLLQSGKIKSFTILLNDDEKDLALIHVENSALVPKRYVLEDFELLDGTRMLVIHYENLVKLPDVRIMDVKIARRMTVGDNPGRAAHFHCDLCGNDIGNDPIAVKSRGRTYYACCPGCENTLKRRLALDEVQ